MSLSTAKQLASLITQAVEEIEADTASQIPGGCTSDLNKPIIAPEDALELNPKRRTALRTLEAATHQLLATLMPAGLYLVKFQNFFQKVALDIVVRGRIADLIHSIDPDSTKGGVHIEILAEKAGTVPHKLRHVMRFLASHHIFCELTPNHWVNNRCSMPLRADAPNTLCNTLRFGSEVVTKPSLLELPNVFFDKEAGRAVSEDYQQSAFHRYYQPDGDFFHFMSKSEGGWRAKMFGQVMVELTKIDAEPYKAFDWQKKLGTSGTLIDVGGGIGAAAYAISSHLPGWNVVVQDRPEVVKHGKENYLTMKSTARVEFEEADIFNDQPSHRIGGADVYFLRHILHDWPFTPCIQILTHLRKAAKPTTRLLIYDIGLEPPLLDSNSPLLSNGGAATSLAHHQNFLMLTLFNGEERSKEEFFEIFKASGWILQETTPMTAGDEFIFEGTPNPAWMQNL